MLYCKLEEKMNKKAFGDPVILAFKNALHSRLGERLKEIWLFGSRARGNYNTDSDYDMLVVATGNLAELRVMLSEENYAILDKFDEQMGTIVYTPDLWEQGKRTPLGMNIL